jgi:methyltransferase NSUN6
VTLHLQAVALLKTGGVLVYSTCTITVEENESIVAWALSRYPCLRLVDQVSLICCL